MFSVFRATYLSDAGRITSGIRASDLPSANGLSELFNEFGGMSFQGGIYRILQPTELERWKERLTAAFPNRQNVIPFGYDWLGRLFALDPARLENGEPGVILLEPGTGEALEVPADLASFHEVELVEYHDAALASSFFDVWRQNNHPAPGYHECAGYRVPLFLGGADDISNLELSDIDVYWQLIGQMLAMPNE